MYTRRCESWPDESTSSAALQRYYDQKLEWKGCSDFGTSSREKEIFGKAPAQAQCAWLSVPLNYDEPQGSATTVAVLRFAARGKSQGSLLYNPGGPGGSGILGALGVGGVQLTKSRITERFDVVGFDPRGVGATKPAADCYTEGGTTRGDKAFPLLTMTASLTEATRARCSSAAPRDPGARRP